MAALSDFSSEAAFKDAKRIVIKIGSSLIFDTTRKAVNHAWLKSLAEDVQTLRSQKKEVLIVSSGAVALGRDRLKLSYGPLKLEESQAAAAAGQAQLMHGFDDAFNPHDIPVAQALLTLEDTENRRRWLNAVATLSTLLSLGSLPIINENDTIATEEIRYGDNDRLAARVAQMISADILVLLSDIDGLYERDPHSDATAKHIPVIKEITPQILAMAGGANTEAKIGSGGMVTKLEAARIAMTAGCKTVITLGSEQNPLSALQQGKKASWFIPSINPLTARKQWLSGNLAAQGRLYIDEGAAKALKQGASLLPVGLKKVSGSFERGDAVEIFGPDDHVIAIGIAAMDHEEAHQAIGLNSHGLEELRGYKGRNYLAHRDDIALK